MRKVNTLTDISFSSRIGQGYVDILKKHMQNIPVKVGALAEELGLRVVLATLPLNISGMIQPDGEGGFVIKINRFESKERQRFTIAHEISHFLLHRDKINAGVVDSVLYRSNLSSRLEAEANRLGADIIMPNSSVFAEMSRLSNMQDDDRIASLAQMFQVSRQAMTIRAG
ncbi:ImmA/IrrE family metallo-endopeptidase [Sphingopyxis sp. R3-92]|uniref:ImmA/IrrE family metallo-endopeptidase n=1 Tax=Sphingopyxis sp. R3-92 TaxID=3158553 RepID=UPI003EE64E06